MNAPRLSPTTSTSEPEQKKRRLEVAEASPTRGTVVSRRCVFVEMFAGSGELSKAVRRVMETLTDDPLTVGGTDFLDPDALHDFKGRLAALRTSGAELYFHVAPPCSTFSRARDRSARTRLRSREQPEGFDPQERRTREGNEIALATADMVKFLVNELDAKGSWEQPAGGYMFDYLDQQQALEGLDRDWHILHMCRYGRAYKKPTVFFSFGGLKLPSLNRRCTPEDSCGRAYHLQLGFGDLSTHDAAVYPRQLCAAYAADLRRDADRRQMALSARDRLVSTSVGHVERHVDRGTSAKSARVRRDAEDRESRAGACQL